MSAIHANVQVVQHAVRDQHDDRRVEVQVKPVIDRDHDRDRNRPIIITPAPVVVYTPPVVTGWTAGPGYTLAPQPLTLTGATALGNGALAIDTSGQLAGTSALLVESAGAGSTFVTQVRIYDASGNYQVVNVDQLVSPHSPTVRVPLADGSCVAKIVVDGHSNFGGAIVVAAT